MRPVQVSELRSLLQDGDDEEEEERMGADEAPEKMMVFEADDEAQPAYEPPPKKEVRVADPPSWHAGELLADAQVFFSSTGVSSFSDAMHAV